MTASIVARVCASKALATRPQYALRNRNRKLVRTGTMPLVSRQRLAKCLNPRIKTMDKTITIKQFIIATAISIILFAIITEMSILHNQDNIIVMQEQHIENLKCHIEWQDSIIATQDSIINSTK